MYILHLALKTQWPQNVPHQQAMSQVSWPRRPLVNAFEVVSADPVRYSSSRSISAEQFSMAAGLLILQQWYKTTQIQRLKQHHKHKVHKMLSANDDNDDDNYGCDGSQEKFTFVECCKFHNSNPIEYKFNHTLTCTVLCIIRWRKLIQKKSEIK